MTKTYEERIDLRKMLKRVVGGSPTKIPEAYHKRSPILMAEQITCPVLIIHGTQDEQVLYHHGEQMYDELQRTGRDVTLQKYDGLGHHFPEPIHHAATEAMFRWIEDKRSQAN